MAEDVSCDVHEVMYVSISNLRIWHFLFIYFRPSQSNEGEEQEEVNDASDISSESNHSDERRGSFAFPT